MFGAQTVVAGIALNALITIDSGALDGRIDVDCSDRADVNAVPAGDTFIWVDLHRGRVATSGL